MALDGLLPGAALESLQLHGLRKAKRGQLQARLASRLIPQVDVAVEAGALLDQIKATAGGGHGQTPRSPCRMIDAVYVGISTRRVVGITPKGPVKSHSGLLERNLWCRAKRPIEI